MSLMATSARAGVPGGGLPTDYAPQPAAPELEALLHQHRGGIHGYLRRKGFSSEEADDLTQETLIRAYLHLPGFRGVSMGAWLYRIAGNVAVDYLRKRRFSTVPLESLACAAGDDEEPWARLEADEQRARVAAIIRLLPECHQRILQLRYYEDRSLAEIAEVMRCSPMAAKLRVFRAVTALRKRWRQEATGADLTAG